MQKQHRGSDTHLETDHWRWSDQYHLIVLDTVNLKFQGKFVPIFSRPVLRIVAAYVMASVWSSYS